MTKEELIIIYTNKIAVLSQIQENALKMGDLDRMEATIRDLKEVEIKLAELKAE